MKNIIISLLLSFIFCQQQLVDGIVAVVGDNIVTQNDFFQQLSLLAEQKGISPAATPVKYEFLAETLLLNIINQYVLLEHVGSGSYFSPKHEWARVLRPFEPGPGPIWV